jgi:hypothetical protein
VTPEDIFTLSVTSHVCWNFGISYDNLSYIKTQFAYVGHFHPEDGSLVFFSIGQSVGIVRSRTKATEFSLVLGQSVF